MSSKHEKFVNTVDEHLFCPICHEVLQDPVSCKDGHAFCNECIREWLDTNNTCPLDNTLIKKENLVRLLMVRGIIDNLEVYCQPQNTEDTETKAADVDNSRKTCGWTGMLKNVKAHREMCPYQEVQCPNENCVEIMQRRELEDHDKVCDFKVVVCEECDLNLVRQDLEKHKENDCPEKLIPCPNECRSARQPSILKRKEFEEHLTNVCPKAIVCCPLEEHGCLAKVERQDVDKHVQDNVTAHIMLLAKENKQLKKELTRVKEELHIQVLSNCSYTWTAHDYPDLSKKYPNGSTIESPHFWLRGYKWRFLLCPNGCNADVAGFLSLFLYKVEDDSQALSSTIPNGSSNETAVHYRLAVISQRPGTKDIYKKGKHAFTKKKSGLGWPEFMKASDALSPSYCNNGSLTIQCTIELDKP